MRKIFLFSLMITSLSSCTSAVDEAVVVQMEVPTGSTGKINGVDAE